MRHSIHGHIARLLLAGLVLALWSGFAAAHVRGEVSAINGDVAIVKTVSGGTVEVTMRPDFGMSVYRRITIDDLKPDDYLSIPSITPPTAASRPSQSASFPRRCTASARASCRGSRRGQPNDQRHLRDSAGARSRPHNRGHL